MRLKNRAEGGDMYCKYAQIDMSEKVLACSTEVMMGAMAGHLNQIRRATEAGLDLGSRMPKHLGRGLHVNTAAGYGLQLQTLLYGTSIAS
jgi:hypothetical protein